MDFYILGNTNSCVVKGLRNEQGEFESAASLSLRVFSRDSDGVLSLVTLEEGGAVGWPIAFTPEGQGNYRASLPANLDLLPNTQYWAEISGNAGPGVFHESRRIFAKQRLTR